MSILDFMGKLSAFDPEDLMQKGQAITEAFAQLSAAQQQILANQVAIMAHLGMVVPMPDAGQLAVIEAGTQEFLRRVAAAPSDVAETAPSVRALP